jgi:hypothetical protein
LYFLAKTTPKMSCLLGVKTCHPAQAGRIQAYSEAQPDVLLWWHGQSFANRNGRFQIIRRRARLSSESYPQDSPLFTKRRKTMKISVACERGAANLRPS